MAKKKRRTPKAKTLKERADEASCKLTSSLMPITSGADCWLAGYRAAQRDAKKNRKE